MEPGHYIARLHKGDTLEFSKPGKRISLRHNPVQPSDTMVTKSATQRGGENKINFTSIKSAEASMTIGKILDAGYLDGVAGERMTKAQYAAEGGAKKKAAKKKPATKLAASKSMGNKKAKPTARLASELVMPAATPVTAANVEKALERFGSTRLRTRSSKTGEYKVAEIYRNGKAKIYDVKMVDAGPELYRDLARDGFVWDPSYGDWLAHLNDHLSAAVRDGKSAEATKLLENGGNVNNTVYDADGTPLSSLIHTAVRSQNLDLLRVLLNNGADPNSTLSRNKRTPLIYAVLFGGKDNKADIKRSVQVIQLLISKGADPKAKDDKHKSAMEYANNISYFQKIHDFKQALEGKIAKD